MYRYVRCCCVPISCEVWSGGASAAGARGPPCLCFAIPAARRALASARLGRWIRTRWRIVGHSGLPTTSDNIGKHGRTSERTESSDKDDDDDNDDDDDTPWTKLIAVHRGNEVHGYNATHSPSHTYRITRAIVGTRRQT